MPSRTSRAPSSASSAGGRAKPASASARSELVTMLKDDHKRVKKAYKEFEKLQVAGDSAASQRLVSQVLSELAVHTALEEEFLYPACHEALQDEALILEAEVEHEMAHQLMDQLRLLSPADEKFAARFTVLCEYVMHHVQEEEGELFPKLTRTKIDWAALLPRVIERREVLMAAEGLHPDGDEDDDAGVSDGGVPVRVRSARAQHAGGRGRSASR
jgi:hemerythrin superfamily protein